LPSSKPGDTYPSLANALNGTWRGSFSITELVLTTKSPLFYGRFRRLQNWDEANTLEHNLYGYHTPHLIGRWGTQLQRLRIE